MNYDKLAKDYLLQDCRVCKYYIQSCNSKSEHCTINDHKKIMMLLSIEKLFSLKNIHAEHISLSRTCENWIVN